MPMLRSVTSACCLSVCLLGCAEYRWPREGVTQAEFNRDSYACQIEVARALPPAYVQQELTAGSTSPSTTNCVSSGGGYTSCTTTPGAYVAPITYQHDANEVRREQAARSCMFARGYARVRVK
jgi:hypothetical protein